MNKIISLSFFVCISRCGNLTEWCRDIVYTVEREQLWDKETMKSLISEQI